MLFENVLGGKANGHLLNLMDAIKNECTNNLSVVSNPYANTSLNRGILESNEAEIKNLWAGNVLQEVKKMTDSYLDFGYFLDLRSNAKYFSQNAQRIVDAILNKVDSVIQYHGLIIDVSDTYIAVEYYSYGTSYSRKCRCEAYIRYDASYLKLARRLQRGQEVTFKVKIDKDISEIHNPGDTRNLYTKIYYHKDDCYYYDVREAYRLDGEMLIDENVKEAQNLITPTNYEEYEKHISLKEVNRQNMVSRTVIIFFGIIGLLVGFIKGCSFYKSTENWSDVFTYAIYFAIIGVLFLWLGKWIVKK